MFQGPLSPQGGVRRVTHGQRLAVMEPPRGARVEEEGGAGVLGRGGERRGFQLSPSGLMEAEKCPRALRL